MQASIYVFYQITISVLQFFVSLRIWLPWYPEDIEEPCDENLASGISGNKFAQEFSPLSLQLSPSLSLQLFPSWLLQKFPSLPLFQSLLFSLQLILSSLLQYLPSTFSLSPLQPWFSSFFACSSCFLRMSKPSALYKSSSEISSRVMVACSVWRLAWAITWSWHCSRVCASLWMSVRSWKQGWNCLFPISKGLLLNTIDWLLLGSFFNVASWSFTSFLGLELSAFDNVKCFRTGLCSKCLSVI